MTPGDKDTEKKEPAVDPISGPAGLVLHPKPEEPRRVSRRAAVLIGAIVLLLFAAFAYGGYKRSAAAQAAIAAQGGPKAVAPATAAGSEFTKAIPPGNAALTHGQPTDQLVPPSDNKVSSGLSPDCGIDPKTKQRYRFDPMTGRPCDTQVASVERVAIRRAPPVPASSVVPPPQQPRELTAEERRLQDLYRREQEALVAPTSIRAAGGSSLMGSAPAVHTPTHQNDLAQIAAVGSALSRSGRNLAEPTSMELARALLSSSRTATSGDYDHNMQTRKEQFLENAASKKSDDYLKSTRSAPFSAYEIKAGWEIPAVLEQSLNSDLPGEIKALVMSNVYDTATGRYLLIPKARGLWESMIRISRMVRTACRLRGAALSSQMLHLSIWRAWKA